MSFYKPAFVSALVKAKMAVDGGMLIEVSRAIHSSSSSVELYPGVPAEGVPAATVWLSLVELFRIKSAGLVLDGCFWEVISPLMKTLVRHGVPFERPASVRPESLLFRLMYLGQHTEWIAFLCSMGLSPYATFESLGGPAADPFYWIRQTEL